MRARRVILGGLAAMALAAPPAAGAAAPKVQQLVVFRERRGASEDGRHAPGQRVRSAGGAAPSATARRWRRSCGARRGGCGCATSAPARHGPRDSAGLLVTGIRSDRNRGQRGWVYKVGRRAATAGAGDTGGPFGRGRLSAGQRVTWFYCVRAADCQRTLEVRTTPDGGRRRRDRARLRRRGRRRAGRGRHASAPSGVTGLTGADGRVQLALPSGTHRLVARKDGLVRSFTERVEVP